MFRISGKVVVLETEVGIANLQVVLYDLDKLVESDSAEDFFKNLPQIWQQISGDRLGSVLTDARGEFVLEVEENDFLPGEGLRRPELLLILLAPEDVEERVPLALPPVARLLYYAYDIRFNAGRKECYFIRLPQERLDLFHIGASAAPAGRDVLVPEQVTRMLLAPIPIQVALTDALNVQLRTRLAPALVSKTRSELAFSGFSLSPPGRELFARTNLLAPGESLLPKMGHLIDQRLSWILQRERDETRAITLRIPAHVLADWGALTDSGASVIDAPVDLGRLLAYYRTWRRGTALQADASSLRAYCLRQEARRRFAEVEARCGAVPPPVAGGDVYEGRDEDGTIGHAALIEERVRSQVSTVVPPEEALRYGVRGADGQISAVIHEGPADVTAYHDFQEIQIAFEHVWKEAFDRSLQPFLRTAYREMVRYQNRVSGTDHYPEVRDVDDMRALYEEFRSLQDLLEAEAEAPAEEQDSRMPVPPAVKVLAPRLTDEEWSALSYADRYQLLALAAEFARRKDYDDAGEIAEAGATFGRSVYENQQRLNAIRDQANALVAAAQAAVRARRGVTGSAGRGPSRRPVRSGGRLADLLRELDERLAEPYRFDVFAPGSTNFGVMLTYRQTWEPRDYQVGQLVSTLPLAPKEVRRYSKRWLVKRNRLQKEIEEVQSSRSSESTDTSRADAEIVRQARNRTSFEQTANATINVGMFQGEFGTRFGIEAEKSSSETKRNFREAVLKAAEEYRRQRRLEVETSQSDELETSSSGEISNPNDEITVTYLFYELQRQYLVSERLHRLTPVVLVAREVPAPDEVDEDWLMAHDWILRRVLLDDGQRPALDYLETSIAGDELALEAHYLSMQRQVELVEELTRKERTQTELSRQAFAELKRLMGSAQTPDDAQKMKDISLALVFGPFSLAGGNGDDHAAEKREEIAKLALERSDKDRQEASARLTREVTAMHESVERYTRALQTHFDRLAAIARLRIHVKENILHYMQAIWDHEPADQRYFQIYNIQVPWIEEAAGGRTVRIRGRRLTVEEEIASGDFIGEPWFEVSGALPLGTGLVVTSPSLVRGSRRLVEVADLDNLLGYKGNYQIFPLRETTYLHDYMMQDYVDPRTGGLRDPDAFASPDTDDILDYVCCLRRHDPARFEAERARLLEMVERRMASPRKEKDLVVVPTDSLFIEALPGKHPIMEDFKLAHRALDVKKVQAEVRGMELENLRLAARVLHGEREDPQVDTRIEVTGSVPAVVVPAEGG